MPSFKPAPATETALQEPPRWAWLAFPPVLIIVQYAIRYYDSATYGLLFESEVGIVELGTPAVLLVAIAAGGAALRYSAVGFFTSSDSARAVMAWRRASSAVL